MDDAVLNLLKSVDTPTVCNAIEVAQGNPEAALALLDQPISDALAAQQANVRGDAFFAQNQPEQAREAWQTAQSIAQNQNQPLYGVQFKLDDLGAEEATQ